MKKLFLTLMAVATITLTGCEKNSKDEPQMPLTPSKDVQAIDLGLSVKWANMNIGATTPEGYGAYFAWGETSPKTTYNWSTYKYMQSGKSSWEYITKYTVPDDEKKGIWYNGDTFIGDNKTTLEPKDDAAHVNWGGNWRMPTKAECKELETQCTCTWTDNYNNTGVKGRIFTSNANGNSIFLPASGYYWSSSLNEGGSYCADCLYFDSDRVSWGSTHRCYGLSVRPVCQ
ncbi:MAG: DUF1566 domain-containing protein [Paludibacteraceae bacterium]|nr:DUF1566 domain-containing protein [Paludibacteraceae bacterium]